MAELEMRHFQRLLRVLAQRTPQDHSCRLRHSLKDVSVYNLLATFGIQTSKDRKSIVRKEPL